MHGKCTVNGSLLPGCSLFPSLTVLNNQNKLNTENMYNIFIFFCNVLGYSFAYPNNTILYKALSPYTAAGVFTKDSPILFFILKLH